MGFRFNVKVDDRDYLDYNKFQMIRSHYGKQQIKSFRIILAIIFAAFIIVHLFGGDFSFESILGVIPFVIVSSLF